MIRLAASGPPFVLLQMPNTGSLATWFLPSIIYMVKYKPAERGDGNWGILPWAPHCLWTPKDRYTLIEQSNTIKAVTTYTLSWAPQALLAALVEWMVHGLSKRLNERQLEATRLNKRRLEVTLGFIISQSY